MHGNQWPGLKIQFLLTMEGMVLVGQLHIHPCFQNAADFKARPAPPCSLNSFLLVAKASGKPSLLVQGAKQELERADTRHTGLSLHQERAAMLQQASPSPRLLPKPSTESLLGGSPENTPGTGQRCRCAHRNPLLSAVPPPSPTLQRAGLAPAARGLRLGLNLPKTASFRCVDAVKAAAAAAAAFSVSRVSSFMSPLVRKREICKITTWNCDLHSDVSKRCGSRSHPCYVLPQNLELVLRGLAVFL